MDCPDAWRAGPLGGWLSMFVGHGVLRRRVLLSLPCYFPGGVGSTQQDPERFASLIDDVQDRLFGALPDETWVSPGHGKDPTIGAERPHLAEWRARGW